SGNEHQSAGGRNRAAHIQATGVLFTLRQVVRDAERHFPGNVAGIGIHGDEVAPGRSLTRPCMRSGVVDVARSWIPLAPLEARRWSDDTVAAITVAALACGSFFYPSDTGFILGIDEYISQRGIGSSASPVHTANGSGEEYCGSGFGAVLF